MNRRIIYTIILVLVLAFTLYEELSLRSYLFKNHFYILAGSLPNFLAPIIMAFGNMSVVNPSENKLIIKFISGTTAGLILYEFVQLVMPHMVFDIKDIIASILGALLSYAIIYAINRPVKLVDQRTENL